MRSMVRKGEERWDRDGKGGAVSPPMFSRHLCLHYSDSMGLWDNGLSRGERSSRLAVGEGVEAFREKVLHLSDTVICETFSDVTAINTASCLMQRCTRRSVDGALAM